MSEIVSWLLEQIALQEARAQGDIEHFGESSEPRDRWIEKMARQFLAECEAKRRRIDYLRRSAMFWDGVKDEPTPAGVLMLALEALPFADRPGYRDELATMIARDTP